MVNQLIDRGCGVVKLNTPTIKISGKFHLNELIITNDYTYPFTSPRDYEISHSNDNNK
jgi:hypothetical protein